MAIESLAADLETEDRWCTTCTDATQIKTVQIYHITYTRGIGKEPGYRPVPVCQHKKIHPNSFCYEDSSRDKVMKHVNEWRRDYEGVTATISPQRLEACIDLTKKKHRKLEQKSLPKRGNPLDQLFSQAASKSPNDDDDF